VDEDGWFSGFRNDVEKLLHLLAARPAAQRDRDALDAHAVLLEVTHLLTEHRLGGVGQLGVVEKTDHGLWLDLLDSRSELAHAAVAVAVEDAFLHCGEVIRLEMLAPRSRNPPARSARAIAIGQHPARKRRLQLSLRRFHIGSGHRSRFLARHRMGGEPMVIDRVQQFGIDRIIELPRETRRRW
jgi:hypothetical protein